MTAGHGSLKHFTSDDLAHSQDDYWEDYWAEKLGSHFWEAGVRLRIPGILSWAKDTYEAGLALTLFDADYPEALLVHLGESAPPGVLEEGDHSVILLDTGASHWSGGISNRAQRITHLCLHRRIRDWFCGCRSFDGRSSWMRQGSRTRGVGCWWHGDPPPALRAVESTAAVEFGGFRVRRVKLPGLSIEPVLSERKIFRSERDGAQSSDPFCFGQESGGACGIWRGGFVAWGERGTAEEVQAALHSKPAPRRLVQGLGCDGRHPPQWRPRVAICGCGSRNGSRTFSGVRPGGEGECGLDYEDRHD